MQRATLAEKEVTSLKEQLANHGGGSTSGAAMAPPPPDREDPVISTSHLKNHDFELAAKDKEVRSITLCSECHVRILSNSLRSLILPHRFTLSLSPSCLPVCHDF